MGIVNENELLHDAMEHGYTLAAFNFFNFDMLRAILEAAEEERSPVIIQLCMGGRAYMKSLSRFAELVERYCRDYSIPIGFNHDHCPTVEDARAAIDAGIPAVMFDGSHLPFEENVRQTGQIVAYAHQRGVTVEAELGCLPGFEDMTFAEKAVLTDPEQARRFVAQTGCDCLAVSVGTAHGGVLADEPLPLHFDRLGEIHRALPGFPLVLHGAASLPDHLVERVNQWGGQVEQMRICSEADISKCAGYGVCKANMDVDNFLAYTAELRRNLVSDPGEYNPMQYLARARDAFQEEVRHKLRHVVRSAGHDWLNG